MTGWKAKRFWKDATVVQDASGWHVLLDGRPVRTPAKAAMDLPTEEMASAIAGEWAAQGEEIDPLSMPVTRSANSAIDRVATQHREVAEMLAAYAETDLLCHRADGPQEPPATGRMKAGTRCWTGRRPNSARRLGRPRASCHRSNRPPRRSNPVRNRARGRCISAHRAARPRQPVRLPRARPCGGAWAAGPAGRVAAQPDRRGLADRAMGRGRRGGRGRGPEAGRIPPREAILDAFHSALTHNRPNRCCGAQIASRCRSFVQNRCLRRVNPVARAS
jgi:hypothetical protein